ncbi:MAG TPA: endonuclease/exonuclease/phosphatase family protein [Aeromicrobium sp.]|nr:endonuclease/exonuclease/phosphatase family protein [Aeromicrobium sp.]
MARRADLGRLDPALKLLRSAPLVGPPAIGLIALGLRHWKGADPWELALVASVPYLMLVAAVGPVAALLLRQWWMALASVLVVGACASTQLPLYIADTWPVTGVPFRVMTQNADIGRASAAGIVRAVRGHDVNALVLTELTPELRARLRSAGLEKELPFTALRPLPGARGTGIWSRTRLSGVRFVGGFSCAYVVASADVDWGDQPPRVRPPRVRLVGLHLIGPTWDAAGWRRDAAGLPGLLRHQADSGRTIVAGDFNATPDSPWLRAALDAGLTNAADGAGAGLVRTYPADFPVLAIDHVLSHGLVAQSVVPVTVAGTDHRGIVATLGRPLSG